MEQSTEQLTAAVLSLPAEERVRLADRLLASLDVVEQPDAEWVAEIRRRLKDIDEGREELIDAEEVHRLIQARTRP